VNIRKGYHAVYGKAMSREHELGKRGDTMQYMVRPCQDNMSWERG